MLLFSILHMLKDQEAPCRPHRDDRTGVASTIDDVRGLGRGFANTALRKKYEVKVFLLSAGVEVESIVAQKYNAGFTDW